MNCVGIDIGSSTIKILVTEDNTIVKKWKGRHRGIILSTLILGLKTLNLKNQEFNLGVTGGNSRILTELLPNLIPMEEIPAILTGVQNLVPLAGSIIEIGSQGSRFITDLDKPVPRFSSNEHCAGGTGSFFEDQMTRLGLHLEDFSSVVEKASFVPRLSGRCSVFAKTDIIHRQQEGASTSDILLGLCYAMITNYKATILRGLPINKPVVFCGGVTKNTGVIRAIKQVLELTPEQLIIPSDPCFVGALGAALEANYQIQIENLLQRIEQREKKLTSSFLPPLKKRDNTFISNPSPKLHTPATEVFLGIDIGSTSTNLVLLETDGSLIDYQYLRTGGNPELVLRQGLANIKNRFGQLKFRAVGITGSGRERLGRLVGADVIRDEITAQAKAATFLFPDADTIFEIGGQDSKFISLEGGQVVDFQMNKICAAGTGSFIEEQAARMGISLEKFGHLALEAKKPCDLGERCTVFIETAIASASASGASPRDVAAGLCHSVVKNYLNKVVGNRRVGKKIILQGGVAYNPGIVAAFQHHYGEKIVISPYFPITGAFGVALLALEGVKQEKSSFKGFDFPSDVKKAPSITQRVAENKTLYQNTNKLLLEGYDGSIDANKKTVGVPFVLVIHKFFPLVNKFFKALGFNVLLSDFTNEHTIHLSQNYAQGETCYPVKLIYGHISQLLQRKVDYIFLPSVRTIKHESSQLEKNYGCVYMQTAPQFVAKALNLEAQGVQLLNPVFDLDLGQQAMATAMIGVGKQLQIPPQTCMDALQLGSMAIKKYSQQVEQQGKQLLSTMSKDEKVLVLITRNYGISDPILNMGIPQEILNRGYKLITLSHLPAHDLNISKDYPNLYWPFGQHIISGIKIIANHPNLYAVYLTNHGCGPDSMLSHMVRHEMGNKPYLQIEVDEHFSKVGVITRIEAFLNSLSNQPVVELPQDYDCRQISCKEVKITQDIKKTLPLYLPDMGLYTKYLGKYFHQIFAVEILKTEKFDSEILSLGRQETSSKEYIPFPALLGSVIKLAKKKQNSFQVFIPSTEGSEADGQYGRSIYSILERKNLNHVILYSPLLEQIPSQTKDLDLLMRSIICADILYGIPVEHRQSLAPSAIPSWDEILKLTDTVASLPKKTSLLGAVGEPFCLFSLNEGILDELEKDFHLLRAPLSEYLWFLWLDTQKSHQNNETLLLVEKMMIQIAEKLGKWSSFSINPRNLFSIADKTLSKFAGGNGRYRWAKLVDMGNAASALLTIAPRYENTATVLDLMDISGTCQVPLFNLSFDGDWDETAWTNLRSFLHYCS